MSLFEFILALHPGAQVFAIICLCALIALFLMLISKIFE